MPGSVTACSKLWHIPLILSVKTFWVYTLQCPCSIEHKITYNTSSLGVSLQLKCVLAGVMGEGDSRETFNCLKSAIEILEKGVKFAQS